MKYFGNIYLITNLLDWKVYVGQEFVEGFRWKRHLTAARSGKAFYPVDRAIAKHGEENFICQTLTYHKNQRTLDDAERIGIRLRYAKNPHFGYNLTEGGGGIRGWHHSEETKKRISEKNRGRVPSEEERRRNSEGQRGNKRGHHTAKSKKNISNGVKNHWAKLTPNERKKTPEHRQHLSEARKGKKYGPLSKAHKRAISRGNKGKRKGTVLTEEWKKKIGESIKGKRHTQETKDRISRSHKGVRFSLEHCLHLSEARKAYCARRKAMLCKP